MMLLLLLAAAVAAAPTPAPLPCAGSKLPTLNSLLESVVLPLPSFPYAAADGLTNLNLTALSIRGVCLGDAAPSYTAGATPALNLILSGLTLELDAHFAFKACKHIIGPITPCIHGEGSLVAKIKETSFSASQCSAPACRAK